MTRKSLPLSRVYGLLEPGPVVMLTTARDERPNIMTLSWHTMIEFEPPLVGCASAIAIIPFGSGNFMVAGEKIKLKSKMK